MGDIVFSYSIVTFQICKEPDFLTGVFKYWSELLEPDGMGTRYPYIFDRLYSGEVIFEDLVKLKMELDEIKPQLQVINASFDSIREMPFFASCLEKEPSQIKCFDRQADNAYGLFRSYLGKNLFEEFIDKVIGAIEFKSSLKIIYSKF